MTETLKTILTVVFSSGIIVGLLPLLQSRMEYKREFLKKYFDKCFESYEKIETVLLYFSSAVLDYSDGRLYHCIFSVEENPLQKEYSGIIVQLTKSNIYISEAVRDAFIDFNKFIVVNKIDFRNIEDGKKYYKEIGTKRDEILEIVKKDLKRLYKGKKIF